MSEWSNSYHRGEWCLYKALVCQEGQEGRPGREGQAA
jgi:hypothetical protein